MRRAPDQQRAVADFYDEEASSYDERFETVAGRYIHNRQASIVMDQLDVGEGSTVLEIAAGTGRFTELLARQGAEVIVVDASREMLERNRTQTPSGRFILGTGTELPIGDETIDACLTVNALNHIPNHWDVIEEVRRVLRTDGTFLANYPNLYSNRFPIGLYVNHHNRSVGNEVYTKWFDIRQVKSGLSDAGFEIERRIGDRLVPVKIVSRLTIPLSRVTERFIESPPLSDLCVSPFIRARKR